MTRTAWTLAWLLLFISVDSRADDGGPRDPHLRTVEPALVAAVASATDRSRYLRIAIDRRYAGCRRLGILGHELRHAVEIADAASVRDNASLASLYRRIGFRTGQDREDRFDSDVAIDAGHQVEREVVAFEARSPRSEREGLAERLNLA